MANRTNNAQIYVLPKATEAAQTFLEQHPDANDRLQQVSNLITGFETPYGLEMLATIHWVAARENPEAAEDAEVAIALVHEWSERKRQLFKRN